MPAQTESPCRPINKQRKREEAIDHVLNNKALRNNGEHPEESISASKFTESNEKRQRFAITPIGLENVTDESAIFPGDISDSSAAETEAVTSPTTPLGSVFINAQIESYSIHL